MNFYVASITARSSRSKSQATAALTDDYLGRASRYVPVESLRFADEDSLFHWIDKGKSRTGFYIILLDSAGRQLSSEEFAALLTRLRDEGYQQILFAIGPPNGWSESSKQRAQMLFSLGRITLPHELATAVLAEQLYRAFTIAAGHPYHCGH